MTDSSKSNQRVPYFNRWPGVVYSHPLEGVNIYTPTGKLDDDRVFEQYGLFGALPRMNFVPYNGMYGQVLVPNSRTLSVENVHPSWGFPPSSNYMQPPPAYGYTPIHYRPPRMGPPSFFGHQQPLPLHRQEQFPGPSFYQMYRSKY